MEGWRLVCAQRNVGLSVLRAHGGAACLIYGLMRQLTMGHCLEKSACLLEYTGAQDVSLPRRCAAGGCQTPAQVVQPPPPHSATVMGAMVARLRACSSQGSSESRLSTVHTSLAATFSATLTRTRRAPAGGAGRRAGRLSRDRQAGGQAAPSSGVLS